MQGIGCKLTRDIQILPSMCDGDLRLSIPAALDIFQDTATVHADSLGIGPWEMERRNSFWIISKTRMHINRMPGMMDDAKASTWIQPADRASCERDYSITCGDEVLAYGRSIWAIISRDTGRLMQLNGIYPEGVVYDQAQPDDRPFLRISKEFDGAEPIGEYTVRSVDIDLGGHMNNVNYVRAMLGLFTAEQIKDMDISEIELNFISQTYEGETLSFVKRIPENTDTEQNTPSLEIAALNTDGKAVFIAAIQ